MELGFSVTLELANAEQGPLSHMPRHPWPACRTHESTSVSLVGPSSSCSFLIISSSPRVASLPLAPVAVHSAQRGHCSCRLVFLKDQSAAVGPLTLERSVNAWSPQPSGRDTIQAERVSPSEHASTWQWRCTLCIDLCSSLDRSVNRVVSTTFG